jgi:hypothetical protein
MQITKDTTIMYTEIGHGSPPDHASNAVATKGAVPPTMAAGTIARENDSAITSARREGLREKGPLRPEHKVYAYGKPQDYRQPYQDRLFRVEKPEQREGEQTQERRTPNVEGSPTDAVGECSEERESNHPNAGGD